MRTLDGLEYTFNGLGEYTMVIIEDEAGDRLFELQGRTQQAVNTDTEGLSDATFFSGMAAEFVGDGRVSGLCVPSLRWNAGIDVCKGSPDGWATLHLSLMYANHVDPSFTPVGLTDRCL